MIIPLIYFKKRKIYTKKDEIQISLNDLLDVVKKDSLLYVYDEDGVIRNKPNLCSYPKLSAHCNIWVDHSPRTLGDVVDTVLAGATSLTFRRDLWPKVNVSSIRDITESSIYEAISLERVISQKERFFSDLDGIVISSNKNTENKDFIYDELIKNLCKKNNVYVIEQDTSFFSYWKNIGVKGVFLEFNSYKKVNKDEF